MSHDDVVRAAIHPGIGIARVGNSPQGFYVGPEVTHPAPKQPGAYKDGDRQLKREVARFRVYGYNAAGEVVAELTAADAEIEWSVRLANRKAAWYQFQLALDIPQAAEAPPSERRNKNVVGADRRGLTIDSGARTVCGRDARGPAFNSGEFMGSPVYLGELRTDDAGRLLFFPGHGKSASYTVEPATTYANNDTWHDDVADGPVHARVRIGGREIPCDGAWVVVAPPNYAPDVVGVRPLYDVLFDTWVRSGMLPFPQRISFSRDVLPIFQHYADAQWVNFGFAQQFGWGGPYDFNDPELLARLSRQATGGGGGDENRELRRQVFHYFRAPQPQSEVASPWPWMYGDDMNVPAQSPLQHLSMTDTQFRMLRLWVAGDYEDDYDPARRPPSSLDQVPLAEQPAMLDKAALWFCLGEAFHPGCEMTWPVRHASMYRAPFRFRERPAGEPEPDYGPVLTPQEALAPGGPLYDQAPGDVSRWMAVPWQTDTASCRAGYEKEYDPYLPTFWPARVPNHVLTLEDYERAIDPNLPPAERVSSFRQRAVWYRGLQGSYQQQINEMVSQFGDLGVVETRPGVSGVPELPPVMLVESKPGFPGMEAPADRNRVLVSVSREESALAAEGTTQRLSLTAEVAPDHAAEEVVVGFIEKIHRRR